jgi:toxin ParE1/3/4
MKNVRLQPEALQDLRDIAHYIALDNPARALTYVRELRAAMEKAAERPRSFNVRMDLPGRPSVAPHGSYRIYFESASPAIIVIRVLHAARDAASELAQ